MNSQNQLKNYVSRHMRLGVCVELPTVELHQDIIEEVPVVDDDGHVILTSSVLRTVPASEAMRKYKASSFRLTALLKSGVPLKVVNINNSTSFTIDRLQNVCDSVESAENFVQRMEEQIKERESWFSAPAKELENN